MAIIIVLNSYITSKINMIAIIIVQQIYSFKK